MPREVKLNQLRELLVEAAYPLDTSTARERYGDVSLVYADGTEPLPAVLDRIESEQFDSVDDAQSSIMNAIPVEGVGEPGQSEGEG
jgi:hypothetical protein